MPDRRERTEAVVAVPPLIERIEVRLALEGQPHEPQAMILPGNVGAVLHVCSEVGAPNLGANLDIGHRFAALESTAQSAAILAGLPTACVGTETPPRSAT